MRLQILTRKKTDRGMKFQAAGVLKPLCSVDKLIEAGHIVMFDSGGSYIDNKKIGEVNALRRSEGNVMLDIWVPPTKVADSMGFGRLP